MSHLRSTRLGYLALALLFGVLYDVFLWDHKLGLGFFLFVASYLIGFTIMAAATQQITSKKFLWLIVPIIILSADVMIFHNSFVRMYVPFVVFALLFLYSILITLRNTKNESFALLHIPVIRNIGVYFDKFGKMFNDLTQRREEGVHSSTYRKIAIGFIVSVPLLLIFGALFAQADQVFADTIAKMFNLNIEASTGWRIFRTLLITLLSGGLFYVVFNEEHSLSSIVHSVAKFDATIVGTILALLNALFIIFVVIQVKYLFGSTDFVLANGLTFADYARHGFFELVWVVVLSYALLVTVYRSFAHHGKSLFATTMSLVLIAQVLLVAVSALKRMNLYQDVYGFTSLRLYVEWFIYLVVVVLLGLGASIAAHWPFKRVVYSTLASGLVAFVLVSSINVDGIIADRNIARCHEGKSLDFTYLTLLSADATPRLTKFFENQIVRPAPCKIDFANGNPVTSGYFMRFGKQLKTDYDSWLEMNFSVQNAIKSIDSFERAFSVVK